MSSPAYPAGYGPAQQALAQQALAQQLLAQQALAQPTANGFPQVNLHTVLVALRCWWHIVLPIGLLLGAGAATVVYYITKPTYTASAWIEILPPPRLFPGAESEDMKRFVANQIELLRSPPVLEPVIAMPVVRSAPELRDEDDPMLYLRNNLRVNPRGQSDYFLLEFKSQDPAKASIIVNAVADSYFSLYKRHDSLVSQEKISLLVEQAKVQADEVERLSREVDHRTRELGGQVPLAPPQSSELTQQETIQQRLEAQLLDLEIETFTTDVELKAEQKLFEMEQFSPPDDLVMQQVELDPRITTRTGELAVKKKTRDDHKKVSKNLAANTTYQRLETEIAADEAELKKLRDEIAKEYKVGMEKLGKRKRESEIELLKVKLVRLNGMVEMRRSQMKAQEIEDKEIAGAAWELERTKRAERRADLFHEALQSKILSLRAELRAPERVKSFYVASVPTRPDEQIPLNRMLFAALAALLIPFGLAVGIEVLFGRVASRQQLEHAGKIAVVGEITSLPRRLRGHAQDGAQRRDVQLFEESINGLRTYLTLIEASRGRRVLAVTSSISREGKTSLAAQLAVSVANSTGKPTLLIDGDMRSPDIHRIFDVEVGPGLAEVLAGRIPVEEAIETEVSSRLHLLTAGRLTVSPHQLTGGGEFAATIEKLRGMYDSIIIDTPPILPASEALLMAGAADATILCVRRDYSRVDQVSESVQRLVASGVKVAGAVLNGVPIQHYVYRYGSYYYTKARTEDVGSAEDDESLTAG